MITVAPQNESYRYFGNANPDLTGIKYNSQVPAYQTAITPNKNIAGVTQSWNAPNLAGPIAPNGAYADKNEQPVYNNGVWISSSTGQPYTGNFNGKAYSAGHQTGVQVPFTDQYINPNDAASRYQAVDVPKNKPVADATDNLIKSFNTSTTDFSKLLDDSRSALGAAKTGFTQDQNVFASVPNQVATGLSDALKTTTANANNSVSRYADVVNAGNTAQNNILKQANDTLPMYDAAANNIGAAQARALQQQVSRYKLGSGTPMSLGSGEENLLIQGTRGNMLPLEMGKIQQRYNILNGLALPIAQQQEGAGIGAVMNAQGQNQQNFVNASGVVNHIADVQMAVSGMAINDALKYMQTLGVPIQMQQQILSGDINNLGGLNSLYSGSRYQGLQDKLGVNVSQPVSYSFNAPQNTQPSRYATPTLNVPAAQPPQAFAPAPSRYNQAVNGTAVPIGGGYYRDAQGNIWDGNGNLIQSGTAAPSASRYSNPNTLGSADTEAGVGPANNLTSAQLAEIL
jgi:hypothetical protein